MTRSKSAAQTKRKLRISEANESRLVAAARDEQIVYGLTHNFYRYPARFSPALARAIISCFTRPGDYVLDPFAGGGTSMVEAMAAGRDSIGIDISSLATFVTSTKTTKLTSRDVSALRAWARQVSEGVSGGTNDLSLQEWSDAGYHRHLTDQTRWRLRREIEQALSSAVDLKPKRRENFARCVVLRTGQWALDGRRHLPSVAQFRAALLRNAEEMLQGAIEFRNAVEDAARAPRVFSLNRSCVGLEDESLFDELGPPKLVLTSPPYPGVHVLYHRWQVGGGKETPAPFWIADKLDGAGSAYYTMGDRQSRQQDKYFNLLGKALSSVSEIADHKTVFAQVVAFGRPRTQLQKYLAVCESAGLKEVFLPNLMDVGDGRLWRNVPNRKWYADQKGRTPASREVVLFHRKVGEPAPGYLAQLYGHSAESRA